MSDDLEHSVQPKFSWSSVLADVAEESIQKSPGTTFIGILFAVFIAGFLWFVLAMLVAGGNMTKAGTFGDLFGGFNAVISGLAFVAVGLSILMQSKELHLQRKELSMQRESLDAQRAVMEEQRTDFISERKYRDKPFISFRSSHAPHVFCIKNESSTPAIGIKFSAYSIKEDSEWVGVPFDNVPTYMPAGYSCDSNHKGISSKSISNKPFVVIIAFANITGGQFAAVYVFRRPVSSDSPFIMGVMQGDDVYSVSKKLAVERFLPKGVTMDDLSIL